MQVKMVMAWDVWCVSVTVSRPGIMYSMRGGITSSGLMCAKSFTVNSTALNIGTLFVNMESLTTSITDTTKSSMFFWDSLKFSGKSFPFLSILNLHEKNRERKVRNAERFLHQSPMFDGWK